MEIKYHINIRLYFLVLLLFGVFSASTKSPIIVITESYRLIINSEKGTIESFQASSGNSNKELLITNHGQLPLLKIEFLSGNSTFQTVSSSEAKNISVTKKILNNIETVVFEFEQMGSLDVNAKVTVRCPQDKSLTYWSLDLDNQTNMWIGHIQFPIVEVPFDTNPTENNCSHILSSLYDGVLLGPVEPTMVAGTWRGSRRNTPETWRTPNYPRECTIQLMAYYNESGGLYISCEDQAGMPKLVAPLIEQNGVTMGIGHYPATRGPGKTKIPYEVVVGTFNGNWYEAASIYREWAEKQPFCSLKISERPNYPKWLLAPLVGIAFPMRGQGDWDPPASINHDYTPATNALPHLDKLAKALNASLMPIVFNWEHSGPWVQPEAFPPVGGAAEMKLFMTKAKAMGWHPVLYGDGLNWVVAQRNTNYNGMPYFASHGGDSAIVQRWNASSAAPSPGWRSLYNTCVATAAGRRMIIEVTRGMAELGPDVIQQFDQGVGAVSCYATNHGHAPVPGPWMTKSFSSLLKEDNKVARSFNPKVAISSEGAPPEIFLQDFDFWDARTGGGGEMMCPLYSFIYHEYIMGHAGFYTNSVNDEALRAAVARALVAGYFLNFTLRDKGQIEFDWNQTWGRAIPDQQGILDWAQRATELRNGIGKDFLVYGRMQKPFSVTNVRTRDFGYGKEPLVQSATWKAPDGRIGIFLANYSDSDGSPRITLEGNGRKNIIIYNDGQVQKLGLELPSVIDLKIAARSLGLIEIN